MLSNLLIVLATAWLGQAADRQLTHLDCLASNGVELTYERNDEHLLTRGFGTERTFRVARIEDWGLGLRITLAHTEAEDVFMYDLITYTRPELDRDERVLAVLGSMVYMPFTPALVMAPPVPTPVGFIPLAGVSCDIRIN